MQHSLRLPQLYGEIMVKRVDIPLMLHRMHHELCDDPVPKARVMLRQHNHDQPQDIHPQERIKRLNLSRAQTSPSEVVKQAVHRCSMSIRSASPDHPFRDRPAFNANELVNHDVREIVQTVYVEPPLGVSRQYEYVRPASPVPR